MAQYIIVNITIIIITIILVIIVVIIIIMVVVVRGGGGEEIAALKHDLNDKNVITEMTSLSTEQNAQSSHITDSVGTLLLLVSFDNACDCLCL